MAIDERAAIPRGAAGQGLTAALPAPRPLVAAAPTPVRGPLRDVVRRLVADRTAMSGLAILGVMLTLAAAAPLVAGHDPLAQNLTDRLQAPSAAHPFGTDNLGRDVFARVLHGGRISLRVGMVSVLLGAACGTLLGLLSGYGGRTVDAVISRAMEVMLAFPSTLLAIAIVAARGPGIENTMMAIGVISVPIYARVMRASVLSLKEREFVLAARCTGASGGRILFRHILPNGLSPLIVQATLGIATAIVEAAALGFLGLGARPPTPEWGLMLTDARNFLLNAPWAMIFPGLAIMVTVLGFNLLGDGLRDALDPQLKH
ncbi:MAG TPA: ABC transporter permease [Chloroflexota bacterium]|jgi:peptide/nickel transport system permease protein|nr:ABC transporter permease [Chloroflexota bacterium]